MDVALPKKVTSNRWFIGCLSVEGCCLEARRAGKEEAAPAPVGNKTRRTPRGGPPKQQGCFGRCILPIIPLKRLPIIPMNLHPAIPMLIQRRLQFRRLRGGHPVIPMLIQRRLQVRRLRQGPRLCALQISGCLARDRLRIRQRQGPGIRLLQLQLRNPLRLRGAGAPPPSPTRSTVSKYRHR